MNEQTEGDATKLFSSRAEHIKNCTKLDLYHIKNEVRLFFCDKNRHVYYELQLEYMYSIVCPSFNPIHVITSHIQHNVYEQSYQLYKNTTTPS